MHAIPAESLRSRLRRVRRRLWMISAAAAAGWALVAASLLALAGAWLDLLFELSPQARLGALACAATAGLVVLAARAALAARAGAYGRVARRVDHAGHCRGEVITGWELEEWIAAAPGQARPVVSEGLARLAVERSITLAGGVPASRAVPARPLGQAAGALAGLVISLVALTAGLPELSRTQWLRFTDPFADVPPFSRTRLRVQPGDVRVLYGNPLEIVAQADGAPAEQLEMVLQGGDGGEVLPMFPGTDGRWRASLAEITAPARYHVRAGRARSRRYRIDVITVPRIRLVEVRVTPPAYTGLPPYAGPVPKDGISGLSGTEVWVTASSNRPLASGEITLTWATAGARGAGGSVRKVPMQPAARRGQAVRGKFLIAGDGRLEVCVTDTARQPSRDSFSATVTMLKDQRPLVRLLQPQRQSLATPDARLPVRLAAEDDYGVARLQLFRSLNDSRPRPASMPVPARPPRRLDQQSELPLAEYRLSPGDVIKLFGRVEDNDPAGAKGSESEVVTVRIISQEELVRLAGIRQGVEALVAKYAEARRRMERLSEAVEALQKRVAGQAPGQPVDTETQQQAQRLREQLQRETEALRGLARHALPYDADRNLAAELEALAQRTERMAKAWGTLLEKAAISRELLERQLQQLADELRAGRQQYAQRALMPLELLEALFPLIADESRFVMLALRQIDLAERMASLKGRGGEDNPALRARLRDLEEEQREIREQLDGLLAEIEDHARQLPEDEQFALLRRTAIEFANRVRASGASAAMEEAEAALAEFAGERAAAKAREAAEILRKFIAWCERSGMAEIAGHCLAFQPALSHCLGDTISQLLAGMGLPAHGSGGFGAGSGQGGYTAYRGGWQNVGVYGSLPGMGDALGARVARQGSDAGAATGGARASARDSASPVDWNVAAESAASGAGPAQIPLRYRQRVGQYFRRLAEEWEGR